MIVPDRPRRVANPLPIVVAVVAVVLVGQLLGAAFLAVAAQRDSNEASLGIARVIADSYASRGSTLAQPAMSASRDIANDVVAGQLSVDEPEQLAAVVHGFLLAHPPFTSVTVAEGDRVVRLTRGEVGDRVILATGTIDSRQRVVLDGLLRPVPDAPAPGPAELSWLGTRLDDAGAGPAWAFVEGAAGQSDEAVVSVTRPLRDRPAVVGVGLSPAALEDTLADGGDDAVATAFLIAEDGTVVAGPAGIEPDVDTPLEAVPGGAVGTSGSMVVYERPVGSGEPGSAAPDWSVHVEVSPGEIVPAVASFPRTILIYVVALVVVVVFATVVMWHLRRPLSDLALRARTDPLTGLANRHELEVRGRDMLDAAVRRHATVAVVVMDLDNFKSVNDEVGHEAGDIVLRACAHALELHSGPRDVVARLGGDEFAVVRWVEPLEDVEVEVERLRADTEHDIRLVAPDASDVGVSAGYASTATARTYRIGELLRAADEALVGGRRDEKGSTYAAVGEPLV